MELERIDSTGETMSRLSLRILATALSKVARDGSSRHVDFSDSFWGVAKGYFRDCLHNAVQNPREAALSAQCIRLMENMSPNEASTLWDDRLLADLLRAHEFGSVHHLELARESQRLIEHCLQNVGNSSI